MGPAPTNSYVHKSYRVLTVRLVGKGKAKCECRVRVCVRCEHGSGGLPSGYLTKLLIWCKIDRKLRLGTGLNLYWFLIY